MKRRGVVFDLDGTLLDTLADIGESMNAVLAEHGYPTHPLEAYRQFVGDGIDTLARRTVPDSAHEPEHLAAIVARNRAIYATRWHVRTVPYDGVVEMLAALRDTGVRLAILSNKPHDFVVPCVDHFFAGFSFDFVYGVGGEIPKKPDPGGAERIVADWGIDRSALAYVGDTNTDMRTARAASLFAVGVTWGFRDRDELIACGADVVVDHPRELVGVVVGNS